jgi:hypothetical protein
MFERLSMALVILTPLFGVESSKQQVHVEISHENGTFTGRLELSMTGTMHTNGVKDLRDQCGAAGSVTG